MELSVLVIITLGNLASFLAGAIVYRKGIRGDSIVEISKPESQVKEEWDEI